jgi:hypothetical protein
MGKGEILLLLGCSYIKDKALIVVFAGIGNLEFHILKYLPERLLVLMGLYPF